MSNSTQGLEQALTIQPTRSVLIDHTLNLIRDLCHEHRILPGELFTGKKKNAALVAARTILARELRRTVGWLKGATPRYYVVRTEGLDLDRYTPISYPVMGELLGMHHTSVLKMLKGQKVPHGPAAGSD